MASRLSWILQFSVIFLCFATIWSDKTCTKQILQKYKIYKMNHSTNRLIEEEKINRSIVFVCCEGYRETSRNKELPNCSPICKLSCGYGYCYKPNLCSCYHGFEVSGDGTCQQATTMQIDREPSSTTSLNDFQEAFEIELPTKQLKSTAASTVSLIDLPMAKLKTHKDSDLKTKHSTRTIQHNDFEEVVSSIKKTVIRHSSTDVTDYSRVQFITHKDSGLENGNPTSGYHNDLEDKVSKQPINLTPPPPPSSINVTDYPRVKFIPNHDSSEFQTPHFKGLNFPPGNDVKIPKPFDFEKRAFCIMNICICEFGFEVHQQKYCYPCQMATQCQCPKGYAFDSWAFKCKPLCNGSFDGCVLGTCIDYNQCKCYNGTEKIKDDNFHCEVIIRKGQIIPNNKNIDRKWYCMLLLIPAFFGCFCMCIAIKRSRKPKANRLRAQINNFPEIRYFHKEDGNHHHRVAAGGRMHNEMGSCKNGTRNHRGGVCVITV